MLSATGDRAIGQEPAKPEYPIPLTSPEQLHEIGLSIEVHDELGQNYAPVFPNRCCVYGTRSAAYMMSFTDAYLARHRKLGFSKESLCLALVSQAKFDPETGKRLPTYVLRDEARLRKILNRPPYNGKRQTPQEIEEIAQELIQTAELPLAVPACFRNGTPYLDRNWRFGLTSGAPVRPTTAQQWRTYGQAYDRYILNIIKNGRMKTVAPEAISPKLTASGYMTFAVYDAPAAAGIVPQDALLPAEGPRWNRITWDVLSPNLPRGYGYALNSHAEMGAPTISAPKARDANFIRRWVPQLITERLRRAAQDE